MENMFKTIRRPVYRHQDIQVIYPVHMNPVVREIANRILGENERIHLIEPLDVIDFHNFSLRSYLIFTDSGGVQEEAPSFGVPVLVLRDTTERPEGVRADNKMGVFNDMFGKKPDTVDEFWKWATKGFTLWLTKEKNPQWLAFGSMHPLEENLRRLISGRIIFQRRIFQAQWIYFN
jgi:hypothetical protein